MDCASEDQVSSGVTINKTTVQGNRNIVATGGSGSIVNITTCPQGLQEEDNFTATPNSNSKESTQSLQRISGETINITTVRGDGSVVVSTGSGSTVTITTCPKHVLEEDHSIEQSPPEEGRRAFLPVVLKPVSKHQRLNTKTLVTCRKYIDNLAKLSSEGKIAKCSIIIAKLMKTKTDPDSQVALRQAASFNAIYMGDVKKANRLLLEIGTILPDTIHETEHRLWWSRLKSFAKRMEGNSEVGLILAREALTLLDTVAPGCMTAWLLIDYAWSITNIAGGQDHEDDRRFLMTKAENEYPQAIEHAENEDPKQMMHLLSRVPWFAKIGLALLYLGCREMVKSSRLGVPDMHISREDIRKAQNLLHSLEKETVVSASGQFYLMVVRTCLCYRQGEYEQAYYLAREARMFAIEHSFRGLVRFADSIIDYLQRYEVSGD
ncbi:uncharacterized protein LOC144871824 [Branchiostoma floridae x Branchiostoma japonicum]